MKTMKTFTKTVLCGAMVASLAILGANAEEATTKTKVVETPGPDAQHSTPSGTLEESMGKANKTEASSAGDERGYQSSYSKSTDEVCLPEEMPESAEAKAEYNQKVLEHFDKNGNGKLDANEKQDVKEAMDARRDRMTKKYDTDNDGKLSKAEKEAWKKDLRDQWEAKKS